MMSTTIAPACYIERIPSLQCSKRKLRGKLIVSFHRESGRESPGQSRQFDLIRQYVKEERITQKLNPTSIEPP